MNIGPALRVQLASGLNAFEVGCGTPQKIKCVYYGRLYFTKNGVDGNPIVTVETATTDNPVEEDFCPIGECSHVELDTDKGQIRLDLIDALWYRICIDDPNGSTVGTLDANILLKRIG